MAKSLAELERLRRDLISMIVHDLKMPLSTILPSLDSLLAGDLGPLPKEQAHFVQMARRSGQEMLMLIHNLLDVAKMEEGKLSLRKELFAPADWATSVISNFKPLADAARKQLDLSIGGNLAPVLGDIALLGRVLGNLISNALRHTPPASGEVNVALYRDGNQLAVEVRDNGVGIPEQELDRIFEKFVQGTGAHAQVHSGTGLGLTFCKMIVEAHGGHITVFSQPQAGSLFKFYLPLHVGSDLPAPPEIAARSTD
jgi:signal transduction histidine kinase